MPHILCWSGVVVRYAPVCVIICTMSSFTIVYTIPINAVNENSLGCTGYEPKLLTKIALQNWQRSNFTTRNIGNTNVVRVVSGHILHVDSMCAIGLGCMSSCER